MEISEPQEVLNSIEEDMNYSIPPDKTNLTIWRVSLPLSKSYDKSQYSLSEALSDFHSIIDDESPTENDIEDDDEDTDWYLSTDPSCNIIDSGDGGNLINDAILVFSETGTDMNVVWDGDYEWNKIFEKGQSLENVGEYDIEQAILNSAPDIKIDLDSMTLAGSLEDIEQFIEEDYLYQLVDDVEKETITREFLPLPWDFIVKTLGIQEDD